MECNRDEAIKAKNLATIRKQYRKFVPSLHPDKNKFPGASDAFQLVNEAHRILLDRKLRLIFDLKLQVARYPGKAESTPESGKKSNLARYPQEQKVSENVAPQCTNQKDQDSHKSVDNKKTFWTACTGCLTRYMYYEEIMGKQLNCRVCKLVFTALQTTAPCPPNPSPQGEAASLNRQASQYNHKILGPSVAVQPDYDNKKNSELEDREACNISADINPKEKTSNVESLFEKMGNAQENSCSMTFQRDGENSNSESNNGYIPSFNESSKAEIGTSYVKSTIEGPTNFDTWNGENQKKRQRRGSILDFETNSCLEECNLRQKMSSTKEIPTHKDNDVERPFQDLHPVPNDQESNEYPGPYFSNFNDLRAQSIFEKGQIWAIYDTLDAMPRFYALIREVFSPMFKGQLIWLEPDPDDEEETKWVEAGLPVSCGKFRYGISDVIQELPVFSHLIHWLKGSTDGTFEVHPMKGETWALYKDWDVSWHACSETNTKFEYEFVEVLSDYSNGIGIYVASLYKVEGFSCIFRRETQGTMESFLIPAKERFRFSHRVPSFKMTNKENKGFLAESFELDPASLPSNMNESVHPNHAVMDSRKTHPYSLNPPSTRDEKATSEGNALKAKLRKDGICERDASGFVEVEGNPKLDSTSQDLRELHPNSELEFYNFQENICPNKFHVGQIWAIYCEEDAMPRYYCKIMRVDPSPIFNLYVRWFIACPLPEGIISWVDNEMLTAVGNFKLTKGRPKQYSSTDPFSHLVIAEPTDNKGVYSIFPKKDEVWALYKDWNPGLNLSYINDCEYEIVRVIGENDLCILVSIMKPIKGFKYVFRPQVEGEPNHEVEILKTEILRFSHQIPAFQLTKEKGGSLQGFWELDKAALPCHLLNQ